MKIEKNALIASTIMSLIVAVAAGSYALYFNAHKYDDNLAYTRCKAEPGLFVAMAATVRNESIDSICRTTAKNCNEQFGNESLCNEEVTKEDQEQARLKAMLAEESQRMQEMEENSMQNLKNAIQNMKDSSQRLQNRLAHK